MDNDVVHRAKTKDWIASFFVVAIVVVCAELAVRSASFFERNVACCVLPLRIPLDGERPAVGGHGRIVGGWKADGFGYVAPLDWIA